MRGANGAIEPTRIASHEFRDFAAGFRKTQESEDRQQQRESKKKRRHTGIPGTKTEPEVKADTAVNPSNSENQRLSHTTCGCNAPEREHNYGIRISHVEQFVRQPCANNMSGQEHGNREPKRELNRFPPRHAQVLAF